MSDSRMVDAVNRLVGDLLSGVGEVFLPGIGSLSVERHGAKRVSKRSIVPPCRVVSFSSQQQGKSLVDRIAVAAQVDVERAAVIYETWLARVRMENMLTIEGVGVLKFKNFTLDPEFDKLLNPLGHAPVAVKTGRRFDWALWIGIAAILFAAVFGGYQFLMTCSDDPAVTTVAGIASETLPAQSVEKPDALSAAGTVDAAQTAGMTKEPAGASEPGAPQFGQESADVVISDQSSAAEESAVSDSNSGSVLSLRHGYRYVVLGVYSTPENALRAVKESVGKQSSLRFRIYRFGAKYLVSPFESEDADACAEFIRRYESRFPGLWTYTSR